MVRTAGGVFHELAGVRWLHKHESVIEDIMENRPEWRKPKLFILVRNKEDETVLHSCKIPTLAYEGPNSNFFGCAFGQVACLMCSAAGS